MPVYQYSCDKCTAVRTLFRSAGSCNESVRCTNCSIPMDRVLFRSSSSETRPRNRTPQQESGIPAVLEIDEDVELAMEFIDRHVSEQARRRKLHAQIDAIRERAEDELFYLAVIGEFSSGKSTFINALLRQRLLKSARVATTAAATCLKSGDRFTVRVTLADATVIDAAEDSTETLLQKLREIQPDIPSDSPLESLLELLTSVQSVAESVHRIDVTTTSTGLGDDCVVIDTPGINPGADNAQNHAVITQEVVDRSDAAIILIPAHQPLTSTLLSFLQNYAQHYLHRCVFVITAMDQLEGSEERQTVVDFVRMTLRDQLQLTDPVVLESGAVTMVPVPKVPKSMKDTWEYWREQFVDLESTLRREMLRQRQVAVSERLVRLMQELTSDIRKDVDKRKDALSVEEGALRANSVEAIDSVLGPLVMDCVRRVEAEADRVTSSTNSRKSTFRSKAKKAAREAIDDSGWSLYNDYDANKHLIVDAVKSEGHKFVKKADSDLQRLRDCCQEVCRDFANGFEQHYRTLSVLGFSIPNPKLSVSSVSVPSVSFNAPKNFVESAKQDDAGRAGGGAVVGGILGFLVGGPAGAAVGAAIGGGTGLASGIELTDFQEGIRERVNGEISTFVDKYANSVAKEVDGFARRAVQELQRALDAHRDEYGPIIDDMKSEHERRQAELRRDLVQINADSCELLKRSTRLEDVQRSLMKC